MSSIVQDLLGGISKLLQPQVSRGTLPRLKVDKGQVLRTDTNQPVKLGGFVSDFFRYPYNKRESSSKEEDDKQFTKEMQRLDILKKSGANSATLYLGDVDRVKKDIGLLDKYVQTAQKKGMYVSLMPVARETKANEPPSRTDPYDSSNEENARYRQVQDLVDILSKRYKDKPNVIYGFGAEPYLLPDRWDMRQQLLAKIVRQNDKKAPLMVTQWPVKRQDIYDKTPFVDPNTIYFNEDYLDHDDKNQSQDASYNAAVKRLIPLNPNKRAQFAGEFGGNMAGDFSSPKDLKIIEKQINVVKDSNAVGFAGYRLSPKGPSDTLSLLDTNDKLTPRGQVFVKYMKGLTDFNK